MSSFTDSQLQYTPRFFSTHVYILELSNSRFPNEVITCWESIFCAIERQMILGSIGTLLHMNSFFKYAYDYPV